MHIRRVTQYVQEKGGGGLMVRGHSLRCHPDSLANQLAGLNRGERAGAVRESVNGEQ